MDVPAPSSQQRGSVSPATLLDVLRLLFLLKGSTAAASYLGSLPGSPQSAEVAQGVRALPRVDEVTTDESK